MKDGKGVADAFAFPTCPMGGDLMEEMELSMLD
jgi:hypothetical protein